MNRTEIVTEPIRVNTPVRRVCVELGFGGRGEEFLISHGRVFQRQVVLGGGGAERLKALNPTVVAQQAGGRSSRGTSGKSVATLLKDSVI